jgi:ribosomal protein L35AE/L33A
VNSIQDINSAIIAGRFSNQDLNSVIDAVKFARAQLTRQNKASLMLGDTVQFTSNRTGRTMQGTVQKIAIKFVTVNTPGQGLWRVPASMLTAV